MNWIVENRQSLQAFLPEFILIGASLFTLLIGAFERKARNSVVGITVLALVAYIVLSFELLSSDMVGKTIFAGMVSIDSFAIFFKIFFGLVSLLTVTFVIRSNELADYGLSEVMSFLLALTLGMSMMAASTDLLMMFLSLEMVSVLSYILVGYKKHNRSSSEAGLKYILYGAVASGVMVFGFSYLFGLTGSTDLGQIALYFQNLKGIGIAPVLLFSLLCVMLGLGYKIATFPSQMWCPDVYEGAPLPVTTFLSVGPKAAGFALTIRFFFSAFHIQEGQGVEILQFIHWGPVLAFLAAVTMTLGNLAALPQRNLKRLMAYSSIAHAGYLLMGVATLSSEGIQAVLFYLITYLLMNFGVFMVLLVVSNQLGTEEVDGYRGLFQRSPLLGGALTIFLFSLTGLPPFAGFIGKWWVFAAVIHQKLYWLALFGIINTVISLVYYLRIIKTMILDEPLDPKPVLVGNLPRFITIALALPTAFLFIYWGPVWNFAEQSATSLFSSIQ